jgi:tripartite-type tricarboxylate transporter receptor subunit TctC
MRDLQSGGRRRRIVLGLGAALAASPLSRAWAVEEFPSRPISMVVPFPPGGGFDTIARPFAERLGQLLGRAVVVDNRAGSGGHTLLFANDYLATNPSVNRNTRFDPLKDFAPVSMVGSTQVVMAVRPDFPAKNFEELVALSKKRSLSYGTPGAGTSPHLVGEYLSTISPLQSLHVPYKGTAPAVNDAMGGQIDMVYATSPSVASQIAAGRLRGIAVFGAQRSTQLPEVPTLKEIGGPSVDYEVWYCLLAPAGVPASVLATIRAATRKALDADLAARLARLGYAVKSSEPEAVTHAIRQGLERWKDVVARAKIAID